jgi:protein arginine kinase activator
MLCEKCHQRQANVLVQTNINGQMTQLHICQECAEQVDNPVSFEQFFQGMLNMMGMSQSVAAARKKPNPAGCSVCGQTYDAFKRTGRLGCANCYEAFRDELEPAFRSIQGSTRHEGKFPQKVEGALKAQRSMGRLKLLLAKAIEEEKFEDAAKLRDAIKELEGRR